MFSPNIEKNMDDQCQDWTHSMVEAYVVKLALKACDPAPIVSDEEAQYFAVLADRIHDPIMYEVSPNKFMPVPHSPLMSPSAYCSMTAIKEIIGDVFDSIFILVKKDERSPILFDWNTEDTYNLWLEGYPNSQNHSPDDEDVRDWAFQRWVHSLILGERLARKCSSYTEDHLRWKETINTAS